ncbi:MAG: hypothetical protein KDK99_19475, partial [Verrucomicrobiales bacterium]|nr:hypothetical protein [Verrucomicrobiales bacterium]
MKLEDLTVVLRPRRPWEAVDLGCSLVRRDYGRILLLWLATVGPLWVVLAVALRDHPGWFSLAVWWLKPLYDRVPLYFISRATFGDRPGFRETWKAWPRLWLKFLLPALLWRRLSMIRAFALPVWMLEGQRGAAARARLRGLSIEGGSSGSAATVAFLHLEIAVFFGLLMLTAKLAPSSGLPPIDEWFSGGLDDATNLSHAFEWYSNLLYLASITLIEPFYVGAGFGLYLNCRSKMEGWDIEVVFRMLAQRLQQAAQQSVAVLLMIGLLLGSALGEEPKTAEPPEGPRATLEEVLARPEFEVHSKTERVWIPDKSESGSSSKIDSAWLNGIFLVIGMSGLIALVVFIALGLAKYLRSASLPMKGLRGEGKRPARMVMGLEITEESLPEDLLGAARAAWAAGQPREALSLLYRGALARLVLRARVGIRDSDTEDDCLKRVTAEAAPELAAYFSDLT